MNRRQEEKKVIIVCVDGGTFDLIHPWVRKGYLPTFKRLMGEGVWGELEAEIPPLTVNNILSIVTGKNAGKHGILHWLKRDIEKEKWRLVDSEVFGKETIWDILGNSGKRVTLLNLPMTYPPKPIHGLMITGLLTPLDAKEITYPSSLKDEIERYLGQRYHFLPKIVFRKGKEKDYLDSLKESLTLRFKISKYLLDRYPWDCFFVHYIETDFAQHFFWSYMDETHPRHDPKKSKEFGEAILQIYQSMDSILNEYMKLLKENYYLMIISDHGAGPLYEKFYTNNWLLKEGFLKLKRDWKTFLKYLFFRAGLTLQNVHQLAVTMGLSNLQLRINRSKFFEVLLRQLFLSYHDIDWKRSEAFAMGGFTQIYINQRKNTQERFSNDYYEYLCREIISKLKGVRVPKRQMRYALNIYQKKELYFGPYLDLLPDIIAMPEEGYMDPGDFEFFSNSIFESRMPMSGTHKPNGIFFLKGEDVKQGIEVKGVRVYDIAPLILHLMGHPIPKDMDGKVFIDEFKNSYHHSHF